MAIIFHAWSARSQYVKCKCDGNLGDVPRDNFSLCSGKHTSMVHAVQLSTPDINFSE